MKGGARSRFVSRVLLLLALSLMMGALCTFAVAWGIAIWTRPSGVQLGGGGKIGVTEDGRAFYVSGSRRRGRANALIYSGLSEPMLAAKERGERHTFDGREVGPHEAEEVLPRWTATYEAMRAGRLVPDSRWASNLVLRSFDGKEALAFRYEIGEQGVGWPLICMRSLDPTLGASRGDTYELPAWFYKNVPGVRMTLIPTRVVWRSLAINTMFYALPAALLLLGIGALRRAHRAQRGRCPVCRYDLRGSLGGGCPECGWGRGEGADG
ncbi:MAG: hypothetical protein ACF8NJ_04215 [Phycisphaerales bacterium JB038]